MISRQVARAPGVPAHERHVFDDKRHRYCVAVFVINEGERVRAQLRAMAPLADRIDIVVADGGSTDGSVASDSLGEFRLRAGFVHYPLPYVGALHGPAIHAITHSAEMRPWKLGTGYYDRPIPRRIAEEDPEEGIAPAERPRSDGFKHASCQRSEIL